MKLTVPFALLLVLPLCLGCTRRQAVEYEMTWSEGTESGHVYFDFKDFPTHYVDIVSTDLPGAKHANSCYRGCGID